MFCCIVAFGSRFEAASAGTSGEPGSGIGTAILPDGEICDRSVTVRGSPADVLGCATAAEAPGGVCARPAQPTSRMAKPSRMQVLFTCSLFHGLGAVLKVSGLKICG